MIPSGLPGANGWIAAPRSLVTGLTVVTGETTTHTVTSP
jgi:hypothetical protein